MRNAVPGALIAALAAIFIAPVNAQPIWTSPPGGHASEVNSVAFSPDGKLVASASDDRTVKLWEVATGAEVQSFDRHGDNGFTGWVEAVAFSPDSLHVASGAWDKTVRLWEVATGAEVRQFEADERIVSVAFSPDGAHLVAGMSEGIVQLWEVATGAEVRQFTGHTDWVNAVAYSSDGKYVVSGGEDQSVRLWEAGTGAEVRQFTGHSAGLNAVAFSPDDKHLASAAEYPEESIRLWEVATGTELRKIDLDLVSAWSVAYLPDSLHLASGMDDHTVRLWKVTTGEEVARLEGHTDWVNSVAVSRDGKYLVSGSDDNTVRLWDAASILDGSTGVPVAFDGNVEDQTFTQGVEVRLLVLPEAVGGDEPYTYKLNPALPLGLVFDASARTISGTATEVADKALYTYTVLDANASTDSLFLGIEVVAGVSFVDVIENQSFPRLQPIASLVLPEATGGLPPIEYTLTPELPEGLVFDVMSLIMTGTPTMVTSGTVAYAYKATGANGSTDSLIFSIEVYSPVNAEHESLPQAFTMHGSYPNPFRYATRIVFDLPWPAHVTTEVLDITGRRVINVPGTEMRAGWKQSIEIAGAGMSSGLYLYRVHALSPAGSAVHTGRFVRIR